MNFFAHAHLAERRSDSAAWLVGSMAPDFASMGRLRLERETDDATLSAGIAFHHQTDDAFHSAPRFVQLMRDARVDCVGRGLGPGPALAIGHVGVELLLDGHLALAHGVSESFRAAVAESGEFAAALAFRGDADQARTRWRDVCRRLANAPVPEAYAEPEFVADRLLNILAPRRRLRIEPHQHAQVWAWAEAFAPQVAAEAAALLDEVEQRLQAGQDA